jgi:hypothetical protein
MNSTETIPAADPTPPTMTPSLLTLDDLAKKSFDELEALYRAGTVPSSLRAVDGALVGRMLAVRHLDRGPLASALRRFAASRSFVWAGKTFRAQCKDGGRGINRVVLPSVLGRPELFPFVTSVGPSVLDARDTIVLDYDQPENPPYIRRIRDELRQVAPGMFLGPAMWEGDSSTTTVLWFALAAAKQ